MSFMILLGAGAKGYRKRPGVDVLESSRKKQFVLSMMSEITRHGEEEDSMEVESGMTNEQEKFNVMMSPWVAEQEQYQDAGTIKGTQNGDNMDLDIEIPL